MSSDYAWQQNLAATATTSENKHKPLTDEQLVVEMARRGYKVARRTIAKYRSQLGIPLARWRKEI